MAHMSRMGIAVLASGRGTDFQSIIDAVERGELHVDVRVMITNKPEAFALQRAEKHGSPAMVIDHRGRSREDFEDEVARVLEDKEVELVVLAGFMRILTPGFVDRFYGRLINIHPSLLPSFPGAHAHRDALNYGVKVSGCTIHFVSNEVDGGPIIAQKAVEVLPGDDEDSLGQRVLAEEHKLLPEVVRSFAQGKLRLEGKKVIIE